MKRTLGSVLREARAKKGVSLRQVEKALDNKISNGHLSLLESDEIQQPSPRHLYLLAKYYELDYSELMSLAGYFMPPSSGRIASPLTPGLAFSAPGDLGPGDRQLIEEMVEYLRSGDGELARRSLDMVKMFRVRPK